MDILVEMAAHILELLCMTNDQVLLTRDTLTRFHSRAPPGISIVEYLRRIVRYTNLEVGGIWYPLMTENPSPLPPCVY